MNKKIITILVIISLLCTGLTSIYAQDNNDNIQSKDAPIGDEVITENTNETNENQNTITAEAENQTANNTTANNTNRTEINKVYDMIKKLDKKQQEQLVDFINNMGESEYNELGKYLNTNNITEEELYQILGKLDDEEYCTLYIILYDIHNNNYSSTVNANDISKLPQKTQDLITSSSNTQLKEAVSNKNNPFNIFSAGNHEYKLTSADKYFILKGLLDEYLDKSITFDLFKESLNILGFDLSNFVLNPDGTISWNGLTIPAPSQDNIGNIETNTTTNSSNDTNATVEQDNTQQTTPDESNADTNQQTTDNTGNVAQSSSNGST